MGKYQEQPMSTELEQIKADVGMIFNSVNAEIIMNIITPLLEAKDKRIAEEVERRQKAIRICVADKESALEAKDKQIAGLELVNKMLANDCDKQAKERSKLQAYIKDHEPCCCCGNNFWQEWHAIVNPEGE